DGIPYRVRVVRHRRADRKLERALELRPREAWKRQLVGHGVRVARENRGSAALGRRVTAIRTRTGFSRVVVGETQGAVAIRTREWRRSAEHARENDIPSSHATTRRCSGGAWSSRWWRKLRNPRSNTSPSRPGAGFVDRRGIAAWP